MKNKFIIGAVSAAIILGGAVAVGATKNDLPNVSLQNVANSIGTTSNKEILSYDEAVKIALSKAEGIVESVELENKRGKHYYEIEIDDIDAEYEIHIDAYTGEILFFDEDKDDDDRVIDKGATQQPAQNKYISTKKAIEMAEKAVNGKVVEIDRDDDNGLVIYEIELKTSKGEVELELDAVSGKVLKIEDED
ncbi:PepSY domain-containing protein [Bacillus sp. Bva_UNVM-123]|uniref:PepSY domain-containing protein n=1 Tax=Bacillus sp. Bva_UNVM-123 TaxID=2829798 RepID=UPI00391F0A1A